MIWQLSQQQQSSENESLPTKYRAGVSAMHYCARRDCHHLRNETNAVDDHDFDRPDDRVPSGESKFAYSNQPGNLEIIQRKERYNDRSGWGLANSTCGVFQETNRAKSWGLEKGGR